MGKSARIPPITLTARDIRIILMVYSYWGLTTDVLARAFWPTSRRASLTHYGRLRLLTSHGYLQSRPISTLSPYGVSRTFYTIGRRAISIIAHHLGLAPSEQRRSTRIKAPANIAHHALASHFRLSVEWAARELGTVIVDDWHNEVDLEQTPVVALEQSWNNRKEEHVIKNVADREFTIYLCDRRSFSFLVEIDRASVPRERLRQKLRGYLLHARAEPEAAKPVLWVVPHQGRREAIAAWAQEEAAELRVSPALFALAESTAVTEHSALAQAVWHVPSLPPPQTLIPRDALPQLPDAGDEAREPVWLHRVERRAG